MPTHHRKHHHTLSKSFEGQFDQTEAAASSNKQEAKDQRRREQARIRVARYRARKKEKKAQEDKEKLDQEAKDQRRREQARIRSARYRARKKEQTIQEEKEKLAQEKAEEQDITTKGIIKEKKTDQLEEHCAAKKKEEKMILQGDSNNNKNDDDDDNNNKNNNIHDIATFAASPTPSSAALTTSNYPANSSLSTPSCRTDSMMTIMRAGGGGGQGAKLSTPVDVLKARVDVTYHLSDIIKESANKRIDEIDDREKKLTHVCQARDDILKCLYDEMKSEQSYLHPPITDSEQSGRTTSTSKRRNMFSSTAFPAVIDSHETPTRTIKMPRIQEHISNDGATMHSMTGHEEDIAADEEDATMENATTEEDTSTTATLREQQEGGVAHLLQPNTISSPFPAFCLDGKFNIGSAGHSSSSDKRKKKARGRSNYKK